MTQEELFHCAMLAIYDKALDLKLSYRATRFRSLVENKGGNWLQLSCCQAAKKYLKGLRNWPAMGMRD